MDILESVLRESLIDSALDSQPRNDQSVRLLDDRSVSTSSWTTCCWTGLGWRLGRTADWSAVQAAACSTWALRTAARWRPRTSWPRCWSRTGRPPGRTGTLRRPDTVTGYADRPPTGCTVLSTRTAWPTVRGRHSSVQSCRWRTATTPTVWRVHGRPGCTEPRLRYTGSAVWSPRRTRQVSRSLSNLSGSKRLTFVLSKLKVNRKKIQVSNCSRYLECYCR